MKRPASEVRYPHSANLFQFCKKVLDHKFGGIRIIDQDVGQILGFDPADCSHWKKGKKNVRSIHAMKAIAEHLGVDEQLVVDVASGDISEYEGFFEYNGYGEFEVEAKIFENARKELFRKNASFWTKEKELELRAHCDRAVAEVDRVVKDIHEKINFMEAPLYLPELVAAFPQIEYLTAQETESLDQPVASELNTEKLKVSVLKDVETRPYVRFQIAKSLSGFFMAELLKKTTDDFKDLSVKLNDIFGNVFAAKLLAPANLIRKEMQQINISKDIVTQLSEVFWVSKTFMNRRLKDVLQNT